ncbi:hypothetical protein T492DRAFT_843222 [Pavlovales sp. CCMP2436]|nr:hypothetical protein T492DRAFT_843222 [Pavlovales sp. CCMP2436]
MAPALKALLLAVALAAQGGYALRSLSPLAGGPRHRHIASRPALSRAHSTGDAPIRSAAVQMDASAARSPDPPSGQRTAALRQPRRRIARWVMRTARLVFFSLTLMKMLTFARAVHASSASSVVENPQAQHATKGYKRASGPVASADVSSANRLRQKANAARERRGPELANVVATKAPRASLSQGAEQTGIRAFVAKGKEAMAGVSEQLPPGTTDALVLLAATALVVPMLATLKLSPILARFFAIHGISTCTFLGVVFFLFEMGLELSIERLKSLSKDAFGLGIPQFLLTTLALAFGCEGLLGLPRAASLVIGGSLALSSSAFVIQLLQEKGELATRYGRASFGILLLQMLLSAALKGFAALSIIGGIGPIVLRRAFRAVTASKSQEAFVAITLFTVLSMSTFTKCHTLQRPVNVHIHQAFIRYNTILDLNALGLSDTLGAFLAGVLLAESKYRYQIEADIAPFRGILFGATPPLLFS